MKTLVKIAETSVKQDKNGRNYKTCTFSTPQTKKVDGVTIYLKPIQSAINLFEKSYLDQQEEFGYSVPIGYGVEGAIEVRNVEGYNLPDTSKGAVAGAMREVNTFKTIVLGDATSPAWESKVINTMASKGHKVVNSTPVVAELPVVPTV